ncbi:MAG: ATPase [Blautia sp.]|nr:ATPase [Blautia sp.]
MNSRIEQIIKEIEEYIDSCKYQALSTTKIVVNKEEMEEYLRELRLKTPEEIKAFQKVISNKDKIISDANAEAEAIVRKAQMQAADLVQQDAIMQKAYTQANDTINEANRQAQQILDSATQDANNIRLSAITYTDQMLASIADILSSTLGEAGEKYQAAIQSLQTYLDVVNQNRAELAPQTAQAAAITGAYQNMGVPSETDSDLDAD